MDKLANKQAVRCIKHALHIGSQNHSSATKIHSIKYIHSFIHSFAVQVRVGFGWNYITNSKWFVYMHIKMRESERVYLNLANKLSFVRWLVCLTG